MIYEIRDYHYRKDLFEEYKAWGEEAVPILRDKMDLVGFWVDAGIEPEVDGTKPMDPPIGYANITWILRWESKEARDKLFPAVFASDEWKAVWAKHPDPNGYEQTLSRYMDEM